MGALMPLGVSLLFGLIIFSLAKYIFKDRMKAGLMASGVIILVFSYGHALNMAQNAPMPGDLLVRHRHLMPIWFLLLIALAFIGKMIRGELLVKMTRLLNVIAAILVAVNILSVASFEIKQAARVREAEKARVENVSAHAKAHTAPGASQSLPDIYYLIFDRYGNRSVLKEFFDYDNSELISFLQNKGFHVVGNARANYPRTAHSLASSLNMKYINYLADTMGENSSDWRPLYDMLRDFEVARILKSNGYKLAHFGSWWEPTRFNRSFDLNVNPSSFSMPEFSRVLFSTTVFFPFIDYQTSSKDQWRRVLYKFRKLAEIPDSPGSTFAFAHMLIPHPPFVFDSNGDFLPNETTRKRSREENYVNQLIFLNKKIMELVETLMAKSETPPVIIIQADEGPFTKRFLVEKKKFNWEKATDREVSEKIGILNAIYIPGVSHDVFHQDITPVNTFRILFNHLFKAQLPLLPDESYMFKDGEHIYKFFNVTKRVEYK